LNQSLRTTQCWLWVLY